MHTNSLASEQYWECAYPFPTYREQFEFFNPQSNASEEYRVYGYGLPLYNYEPAPSGFPARNDVIPDDDRGSESVPDSKPKENIQEK